MEESDEDLVLLVSGKGRNQRGIIKEMSRQTLDRW